MSIIKQSIQIISGPLAHIMNLSIARGVVPDQMKIARVLPLFKADDQSLFTNYRPVSVLPSFSKFLERIIYNRLYGYLTNLHILCDIRLQKKPLYNNSFTGEKCLRMLCKKWHVIDLGQCHWLREMFLRWKKRWQLFLAVTTLQFFATARDQKLFWSKFWRRCIL